MIMSDNLVEYKQIKIDKKEIEHLKSADNKMKMLIDLVGNIDRDYIPNPFIALINSIIFQQIAYKSAITIWNRFKDAVKEITPENILSINHDSLKKCGLSRTKINYIQNISQAVINRDIALENINKMSNEEIIKSLIKIKGIGEWTAEMFLIFSLNRKDILSYKDLGVRKGIQWLYNMNNEPTKDEFARLKEKYSPFNSVAAFYLWEITIRNYFKYEHIDEIASKAAKD